MSKGKINNGNKPFDGTEGNTFSKDNQPSPESKKRGHRKKRLLKDISEMIASGAMADIADEVCELFGLDKGSIDIETLADLKQLQKAVNKGDTHAYNAYKDRLRGKPQQKHEVKGVGNIPVMKWADDSSDT